MITFNELYDNLIECGIAKESEINLVCSINGSSVDTLNQILYSREGYRTWEQYIDICSTGGK